MKADFKNRKKDGISCPIPVTTGSGAVLFTLDTFEGADDNAFQGP
jgi:hypothetical protein